jgi:phosphate transport system substrate-binding protein
VKVSLATRAVGISAVAAIGVAGCGSNSNGSTSSGDPGKTDASGCATGTISGQGSTFQLAMEQQWSSDFANKCSGAQITYTGVGSGAGIQQFGLGKADFAGSDVTMLPAEQSAADKACGSTAISVPITAGGIAIIYNLKGTDNVQLSAPTLAKIFTGKVKTWNDPVIKQDNPGTTLPSTAIKVYHREDDSGTTGVFTGFLDAVAHSDWPNGAGKESTRITVGQAATGSDGVTAGVKQTDGGITYSEVSYAQQNHLATAKVKGEGDYTDISSDSVSQALASAFTVTGTGNDLAGKLDFTKMTAGYPISTVSYALVCSQYSDAAKGKLVKAYLDYAVTTGQETADSLGFAPLPTDLASKAKTSIDSIS